MNKQAVSLWQLIRKMLRYAPKLYALDSLLWLFIIGLPVVPGLILREFFNQLTGESQFNLSLEALVGLLLAIGFVRILAIFLGRITKTQHRFLISALVRRNLFSQLLDQPGAQEFHVGNYGSSTVSMGEIISYFREDASKIEDNVVGTNEILGEGVFAIASFIILLSVNIPLTLLVFLPLIAIAFILQRAEQRLKQYHRSSRQATQAVTGLIGEIFGAVQAIQVAGAQTPILKHFQSLNNQRHGQMVRDQVFTTALNSVLENLTNIGTGLILLVAALSLSQDTETLKVGDFALFVYYLFFVTDFLWFLGKFLALSKQTEVAFERLASLLTITQSPEPIVAHNPLYLQDIGRSIPPLPPIPQPQTPEKLQRLCAHNLTYRYPGSNSGIFDLSFTLERGSFTVITGQVGSGKTTLLQVLLGLLPMESGIITWNNQTVANPATFFVPPRSAYTPQVPHLFSSTLRENILMGWKSKDLDKSISLAVFEQDLGMMPTGLETAIGTKGVRLSGGQLQRTAATRMFVRRPELIVCDDLSSALDIETEQKLWSRLLKVRTSSDWTPTCLVVSHRPIVLQQADQIITIE